MALTKVTRSGITDDSINADKIEDGTIVDADITPGTITTAKLAGTLDLSSKTVTLPNTSVTNAMLAGSIANSKLANSSITINGSATSLGGSVSAGSIDWQSVITGNTVMVAGRGYFVDTSSSAISMTLPSSASAGDTIAIKDYAGTFASNNLTILRNSHKIQGNSNDSKLATARASVVLVYIDATKGWLYTNESNVADLQLTQFTEATGGTVATSGNFKIHTFTGDGCFVVSQVGIQAGCSGGPGNVDYLVVAGGGGGGGGGGAYGGGGGGAGGHRTTFPSPSCNAGAFPISAQTYPITVGAGGAVNTSSPKQGVNGSNSVFSTITSAGGGGGGSAPGPSTATRPCGGFGRSGGSGGSGGGQGGVLYCSPGGDPSPNYSRGTGNTPPVSPSQGNPGGYTANPWPASAGNSGKGGGGGGAGTAGSNGPGQAPGGNGTANSITASSVTRGGGGGNGGSDWPGFPTNAGAGGPGGGGDGGGKASDISQAGTANTGGGGDAGGWAGPQASAPSPETQGAAGGKGIVIIRYKFQ
jgi:phage baseplate assembly protein gpV